MKRINRFMKSDNRAKLVALLGIGMIFLISNCLIEDATTFTTVASIAAMGWFLICVVWSATVRPIHEDD